MPLNPRAAQELDLLLQEGRADNPLLVEGLVRLYANDLFRFAWVIYALESDNRTVQRLLARRAVGRAFTAALRQLHRFQEQPDTFLWLLALTPSPYVGAGRPPAAEKTLLAAHLQTALSELPFHLSPEDIAYILNIPAERVAAFVDAAFTNANSALPPPPAHSDTWVFAGSRAPLIPLTQQEIAALIEQAQPAQSPRPPTPRLFREFAFVSLALLVFIALIRVVPNSVIHLPTPIWTPTPDWQATPLALPTAVNQFPSDVFYEPANPYLIWQQTQLLQGDSASISSLAFSPTEPILAVGNNQSTVILWDMTTFALLKTLEGHTGGLQSLAFSPDGALLASGGGDGTVRLWEMPSGFLVQVLDGHPKIISGLAFSPDGETLAVVAGKELWFWQVNGGTKIASYDTFDQALYSVSYSPDGKFLAVSEADGIGWVLRARDAYPLLTFKIQNFGLLNDRMIFSPDGKYLLSISRDSLPIIIQLKGDTHQLEGEIVKTLLQVGEDSYDPTIRDFNFSPDGNLLVAATEEGGIYLWDTATWTPFLAPLRNNNYDSPNRQLAISFDNQLIAVSRMNGEIGIWQLEDVSAQVAALAAPRYFQRLKTDIHRWTYTVLDVSDMISAEDNRINLEEASAKAGFTVKIPFIEWLGGDHQFDGVTYDSVHQVVYASFWANNEPGALWGFSLLQRKVKPGELMATEDAFYLISDVIGVSAIVEPVQIGDTYGELVMGNWIFLEEVNFGARSDLPQPGDQINIVNGWSEGAGRVKLRWMEGDILYEIEAYMDWTESDPTTTRDTLLLLASSMFAPDQVDMPRNASPYTYPIETGDTCTSLAERFFTTIETILNLNGLSAECTLIAGQTLLLPYPAEPFATTDLNCDAQEETLVLIRDVADPTLITGVALDMVTIAKSTYRVWEYTAFEMGVSNIQEPELFLTGACEQWIALTGGTPTASQTRVFRWGGSSVFPVLNAPGWPASPDGLIASLAQTQGNPFVITLIEYVPNLHPAAGPCPNEVTDYTWNGSQFEAGETRAVLGGCVSN